MGSSDEGGAGDAPGADAATAVVTCFVLRDDGGRDEVLLARRSQRVRTYRGAWGGISGYLEPGVTPLDQAYTELREETGLARDDVELVRVGEPMPFRDDALAQNWIVHPFLFRLLRPEHIRRDWEADTFAWYAPSALAALATVPRLAEALARVYPLEHQVE